ncbi:MAG: rhomboid family intramembrane serine protease [Candidatus Omnitrophica bacterium]|nr:rhomboid family intramembrane serine protease [Candidatus Omnitrophota bacterium]
MFPIRDTVPSRNLPVVTWGFIALNAAAFFFEIFYPRLYLNEFLHEFGLIPARYLHPEWAAWSGLPTDDYWPFLTSLFLHGGLLHLVSNMWFLAVFGDNVEDRMGSWRFFAFYLACGMSAGLIHMLTNSASTVPAIGASGAVAGIMGAYLVMFPRARIVTLTPVFLLPYYLEVPAAFFMLAWFLTQLWNGLWSSGLQATGIAWWAHAGGFAAGMTACRYFMKAGRIYASV